MRFGGWGDGMQTGAPVNASGYGQPRRVAREYGGFWRRLAALLVDGLILLLPGGALLVIGWAIVDVAFGQLLLSLLSFGYAAVLNGQGGTFGKRALGLRVVDRTGSPPGIEQGAVRAFLPIGLGILVSFVGSALLDSLVSLLVLVDHLWMLWDERSQTLHDKMAGTYVVR